MHYEPEPDACRALFGHLKTHAQAPIVGLAKPDHEQAQVLIRLSHGALRKEKYGKSVNHLRAYLVLLERLDAHQDLLLRVSILGGVCHKLIGHLRLLEGKEQEEADEPYRESARMISKVETSIKLNHGVELLRDLRTPLELPRHVIAARGLPAIGGSKGQRLLVPSKSPNHRPESAPPLEIMAHPPAHLPKPAALVAAVGKHNAVTWSHDPQRPDPLYSTILQMCHVPNTVPTLCVLKMESNGSMSVNQITNTAGVITSTGYQKFDERAAYASSVTTGKHTTIQGGAIQYFPLLRLQTSTSQTVKQRSLGCLEVSCKPGKKGFKKGDLDVLHSAQLQASGLLSLWADSGKQLTRLTAVTQAAITAFWKLDYAAVLDHFEQTVREVIAVELCDLYVVTQNPKRGTYELKLVNNLDDHAAIATVPFGEGIAGCVAQTGIAIATADAHTDSRYNPRYDRGAGVIDSEAYQSRCMLSCPIVTAAGSVIGVAQLTNRCDGKAFDDDDMSVMKGLSSVIGRALEAAAEHEKQKLKWKELQSFNADLSHQLEKSASDLDLKLDQLKQAEDRETADAHSLNRLQTQSRTAAVRWLRSLSSELGGGGIGMRQWIHTCRSRMSLLKDTSHKDTSTNLLKVIGLETAEKALKDAHDKKADAEFVKTHSEFKGLEEDHTDSAAVLEFLQANHAIELTLCDAAEVQVKCRKTDVELSELSRVISSSETKLDQANKDASTAQTKVDKILRGVTAQWARIDPQNELENFSATHNVMLELGFKSKSVVHLPGPGSMSFEYDWDKMEQRNRTTGVVVKVDRVDYTEQAKQLSDLITTDEKVDMLRKMDPVTRHAVINRLPTGQKNELLGLIALQGL